MVIEYHQGQNLDSDILPRLCNDLNAKIRNMDELERRHFNDPKSQGCEDLQNLVKLVKVVLNKLLEESDNVGGDPAPPTVTPPADPSGSEVSQEQDGNQPTTEANF